MHADGGLCRYAEPPVDEIDHNHALALMGVALPAGGLTSAASDAAGWIDEQRIDGHRAIPFVSVACLVVQPALLSRRPYTETYGENCPASGFRLRAAVKTAAVNQCVPR